MDILPKKGKWVKSKIIIRHMWLEGCPNPYKMEKKSGVQFFETLYPYEDKIRIISFFIIVLQNYKLACMADLAHQDMIGRAL